MKIVVVGDSYSTKLTVYKGKPTTFTWIHCLEESYEVECFGVPGSSNLETLSQIPDTWDCLIASLSPVNRPPYLLFDQNETEWFRQEKTGQHMRDNLRAARKLVKLPRSIVWSSFSDYRGVKDIHYIPLVGYNELNDPRAVRDRNNYTGCHLTKEGNEKLARIMRSLIHMKI